MRFISWEEKLLLEGGAGMGELADSQAVPGIGTSCSVLEWAGEGGAHC